MQVLGDYRVNATVRLMWNTNAVAGESITRATNGNIRIYKNGSTTERTSSAGITDTEDFDTLTGVHHLSIDLSDNTDAGFYAAANDYFVVLQGATIDGKTINAGLASFSIENRNPQVDVTKWLGTAAATPTVAGVPEVDVTHAGGVAGTFSAGRMEVNATHWGGTAVASANVRANIVQILGTAPTEGGAGRLAGAFTTFFDVAAPVLTTASVNQTGDSFARIGAAGASLSAIPWNASWDAEVQSEVDDALVVQRLDELLNADSDIDGAAPPTVGSVFHELLTKTAGSFTYDQTTDSLEALRDNVGTAGAGLTALGDTRLANLDAAITTRLAPTVAGRTLDVTATGAAGIDWGNVENPTTALNLSATNIDVDQIVASVSGAVGSVAGSVAGSIGSLAIQAKADVNAEVVDALNVDTYAEPGQEAPGATVSLVKKIGYLYKFLRNRITQTATQMKVYADDATTVDQKATVSDDTTTYDRGEIGTGP